MSNFFVTNRIDSFNVILRKNLLSFRQRILNSNNSIVNTLSTSEFFRNSPFTRHWNKLLYLYVLLHMPS